MKRVFSRTQLTHRTRRVPAFSVAVLTLLLGAGVWQGEPISANNVENVDLATNYLTINEALADPLLASGHTLVVSPGTYGEHVVIDIDIKLKSTYETDPTAVETTILSLPDCCYPEVVDISAGWIAGFTITAPGFLGRGVTASGTAVVRDNIIRDNGSGSDGGGVYALGSAQILRNEIRGNAATFFTAPAFGGGVVALEDALVMGNLIEENRDAGDDIELDGAGVYAGDNARVVSNVIRNNAPLPGFGFSAVEVTGFASLINNTITGNVTDYAIYGYAEGEIANNIIAFNDGVGLGGSSSSTISHNLFYGNTLGDGDTGTAPVFADPVLGIDGIHLGAGSPVVDSGDSGVVVSDDLDFDREARVQGLAVEIGADELSGAVGLTLALSGDCPSAVVVNVSGATRNASIALYTARDDGSAVVSDYPCNDTPLDLHLPRLSTFMQADANGEIDITRSVNPRLCGAWMQAVDLTSCGVSNPTTFPASPAWFVPVVVPY